MKKKFKYQTGYNTDTLLEPGFIYCLYLYISADLWAISVVFLQRKNNFDFLHAYHILINADVLLEAINRYQ